MKNKVIWFGLSFLVVAAMLLASCAKSTTSTSTLTTTSIPTSTTTTGTTAPPITTSTTTTTTTTVTGNWWDNLGTPQYGGTLTIRYSSDIVNFDPYYTTSLIGSLSAWMELLHADDWTMNPAVYKYVTNFRPNDVVHAQ